MSSWKENLSKILLLDNGSYEIKHSKPNLKKNYKFHNAKFFDKSYNNSSSFSSSTPFFIQDISTDLPKENISVIGKNFIRPLSRGLLGDIDLELDIWEKIFQQHYGLNKDDDTIHKSLLIFTYTPMAPDEVIEGFFEIIFEYFGFDACIKSIPHLFTSYYNKIKYPEKINKIVQLVVDSGFSSTTIVPIFNDKPVYNAIKRVEISGKLMTNYLKECLSSTIDLDIRKEFFLANLIKEETCFFSKNFEKDMYISKNTENYIKNFILPEYRHKPQSFFENDKNSKYSIKVNNLRFIVPELLFNPNIIGIDAGGINEGIVSSINECHNDYKNLLYQNIITTGGNSKIPGFNQRLCNELMNSVEQPFVNGIQIFGQEKGNGDVYEEPTLEGMKLFAQNNEVIKDLAIRRNDYDEIGFNIVWKNCL